ncbi:MAG: hypothetical protein IJ956_05150 [Akkermansia sp.]|nr:hypothetical protein [Akkermansia sp.]
MREELPANEDIIFTQQIDKVVLGPRNKPRRMVNSLTIIFWLLFALAALDLWLLRLLGYISAPW